MIELKNFWSIEQNERGMWVLRRDGALIMQADTFESVEQEILDYEGIEFMQYKLNFDALGKKVIYPNKAIRI